MVKPEAELEELALRIAEQLDRQRSDLIAEVRAVANGVDESRMQAVAAVRARAFLSDRLAGDLLDIAGPDRVQGAIDELKSLCLDGPLRGTVRDLVAYFLKYRFVELTDLRVSQLDQCCEAVDEFPDSVKDFLNPAPRLGTPLTKMLVNRVRAIPWLGGCAPGAVLLGLHWLVQMRFLEFAQDRDVAARTTRLEMPVLRLFDGVRLLSAEPLQSKLKERIAILRQLETARKELVVDLGTGVRAVGAVQTYELIKLATPNDVLKIGTYHLRTVVGERELGVWLREKPTLRVQILCLGPTKVEALTEGADPANLRQSLLSGVRSFRALDKGIRHNVSIRRFGDVEAESYFRGAILCSDSGSVKRLVATVWPYGTSRGNYGEVLLLNGDSSGARLLSAYFDQAWENSPPLATYRPLETFRWVINALGLETIATLLLVLVGILVYRTIETWQGDAFFAVVGASVALVPAAWRTLRRVMRAG